MKRLNIGLVGFGTVGSGVHQLLTENAALIARRTGIELAISAVCDLRVEEVRACVGAGVSVTTDWKALVNDPAVDLVVELIGGLEPAKSIHLSALAAGKSVVTANKKLLAEDGAAVFAAARAGSARIGFEAAVGGGIPCLLSLRAGLVGNAMHSVMGILNGTTNYILTRMEEGDMPFADALKLAQQKGFAEADPTFDIEGFDAGHKIALLAMLAYGRAIDYRAIPIEGITRITSTDIAYARDMGYRIKLLGIAKEVDGALDIRVQPTMIPARHPLAAVRDEFNAILYDGDMTGPVVLNGRGAGSTPTASAVVADIVQLAGGGALPVPEAPPAILIAPGELRSRYYLRLGTEDRPGILSQIAGVLGDHGISISSVIQKEEHGEHVPLIFMTHGAREEGMRKALETIGTFPFIHGDVMLIRVEDSLGKGGGQ